MSKDEVEIARDEVDSVLSGGTSFIAVMQSTGALPQAAVSDLANFPGESETRKGSGNGWWAP